MRDARREAFERLGGRFDPRVLEPSPPAVTEPPFFADDPVSGGDVVPVDRPGSTSWDAVSAGDEDLRVWCAERWLGSWRALAPLPSTYATTRHALHAVAEHVLAADRHARCGKIGLRYTYAGFGTPFVQPDHQVRVEGSELVVTDGATRRAPLTTVRAAATLLDIEPGAPTAVFAPTTPARFDDVLPVSDAAALALADWFGFCCSVLEQLRAETVDTGSRVQLWPEHFDLAVDLGSESAGARANFGGSPGDGSHPEPYLYVGPWQPPAEAPFWNEPFGASLPYDELLAAPDQRAAALEFFRHGRALLAERG